VQFVLGPHGEVLERHDYVAVRDRLARQLEEAVLGRPGNLVAPLLVRALGRYKAKRLQPLQSC
jgi:hypothetical protein